MMNYFTTIIEKGQDIKCPSCNEIVFVTKDYTTEDAEKFIRCFECGACVKAKNWKIVARNRDEIEKEKRTNLYGIIE